MSTYIIAIGGTGARLVEAIVHLAAAGLYNQNPRSPEDLHILFIDPDAGNGNLINANDALRDYQSCYRVIGTSNRLIGSSPSSWMRTSIEDRGLCSASNARTLRDAFGLPNLRPDSSVRDLFDVLYTQEEQRMTLAEGFRGRPAVGSAIMSNFIQDDRSWRELVRRIRGGDKVFLCGSIFGGTGASGFPTLGRLLARDLGTEGRNVLNTVRLGGLLMLPYFRFSPPEDSSQIYAHPEGFILRTEAALHYYRVHNPGFDTVYLLGVPEQTEIPGPAQMGGQGQCNPPHFLELYGALALRNFLLTERPDTPKVSYLSTGNPENSLSWKDIPDDPGSEVTNKLKNTTQFAFAWSSAIVPDLEYARTNFRDVRWALRFFDDSEQLNSDEQNHNIQAIDDWCRNYLQWLLKLRQSLKWFDFAAFGRDSELRLDRRRFASLVLRRDPSGRAVVDTSPYLNQILSCLRLNPAEDMGVVSLANSLYRAIEESR